MPSIKSLRNYHMNLLVNNKTKVVIYQTSQ